MSAPAVPRPTGQVVPSKDQQAAPPLRPDPDIIANAEGNTKLLNADRTAAQKVLDKIQPRDDS